MIRRNVYCEAPGQRGSDGRARAEAHERIPIFRLAWDTVVSAFGAHQELYERFFFGDPVRMAGALVTNHATQIQQHAERVREFLKQTRDAV